MHQSNLINLLRTFTPAEWKNFGKYLSSPYLNANKKILALYNYLRRRHPKFDHSKLAKDKAFAFLFPKKKTYNDAHQRAIMADMHKTAEQFLVAEQFQNDGLLKSKLLVRAFGEKDLYRRFEQSTQKLLREINEKPVLGVDDYLDCFLLRSDFYYHPQTKKIGPSYKSFSSLIGLLEKYFTLTKLKMSCELLARKVSLKEETVNGDFRMMVEMAEKYENENLLFSIYKKIFLLLYEGHNDLIFNNLSKEFKANISLLPEKEKIEVLPFLINYSNIQASMGKPEYSRLIYEFNKLGVEKALWINNDQMPSMVFWNIVRSGAMTSEFLWTSEFVSSHNKYLNIDDKKFLLPLAMAAIHFFKNKFEKAEKILNQITGTSPSFELIVKRMTIQCLYEIYQTDDSYFDILMSRINSFEKYLSRRTIFSKEKIERDERFCKILGKFASFQSETSEKKIHALNKIKRELNSEKKITYRSWLLKKIKIPA